MKDTSSRVKIICKPDNIVMMKNLLKYYNGILYK
jgi:hypothetical protein